jgi:hypothetical protein
LPDRDENFCGALPALPALVDAAATDLSSRSQGEAKSEVPGLLPMSLD